MKYFIIKLVLFSTIVISTLSITLIFYGGYVDYFYEKFTTPKSSALILGDSRSLQGIQPAVMNKYFESKQVSTPAIMNYSFTIAQIAYGPNYTSSIKKKLNTNAKDGLFIITVNPWILSERENDDVENGVFFEADSPPHNMKYVNVNPNFEYFFKNLKYFHFRSIFRRSSKLHKDGWLEESNLPKDSTTLKEWKENQIVLYKEFASKWKESEFRMTSLSNLISYLNSYGTVIITRMPIDEKLLKLENSYWPNFDKEIKKITHKNNVNYVDFSKSSDIYKTYDGNHLDKFGGVVFSKNLCDSIIKYNKK